MRNPREIVALSLLVLTLVCGPAALAVRPVAWTHATEADFAGGKCDGVVLNSRGEVLLGREVRLVVPAESAPPVISALTLADKVLYAASGTQSVIYRIESERKDNKVVWKSREFSKPPGAMVSALLWTGKELLAGAAGAEGGIYRIDDKGQAKPLWTDAQVKYVWGIVPGDKGVLYAATGPEGKVFAIEASGKAEQVYSAGELARNILCLARSREGLLYAGTDTSGLVVEIDPAKKTSRVLLDAVEKEVSAIVLAPGGGVYAATSDQSRAAADGQVPTSTEKPGKTTTTAPASAPAKNGAPPTTRPSGKGAAGSTRPAKMDADPQAPVVVVPRMAHRAPAPPPAPSPAAAPEPPQGNAVYFINPEGLVYTKFRKSVAILSMVGHEGQLILGTGNGGKLYSLNPTDDCTVRLADTDAKQVTALAVAADQTVFFATSNKGSVAALGPGLAQKGTYTSDALDAGQIARWGAIKINATADDGASISIATRTGNVSKPDDATWGPWSKEQDFRGESLQTASPPGRFLQYRLTLTAARAGPALCVDQVQVVSQVANLAPEVSAVAVLPTAKSSEEMPKDVGPKAFRHIAFRASDPNGDTLSFTIDLRQAGTQSWIKIAKDLAEPKYFWDTRTVADGVYELRVTAADAPSNPPPTALTGMRISQPVIVDNTPPTVKDLSARVVAGKVLVKGVATDETSRIVSIHYAVDSRQDWTAVASDDGICDSPREGFSFEIADLEAGTHLIVVKVTDLFENAGYATLTLTK